MKGLGVSATATGILVSAILGAGVFSLPFVFFHGGWALSIGYLILLGVLTVFTHVLYWRVLEVSHERYRLLGLVEHYIGSHARLLGLIVIVCGLLLTLVAYLVLAGQFLNLLVPTVSVGGFSVLFWIGASAPLFFGFSRFVRIQRFAAITKIAVIVFVITLAGSIGVADVRIPAVQWEFFALPFGVAFFALSGWTAVEPMFDWRKRRGDVPFHPTRVFAGGTATAIFLYIGFAFAVLFSGATVVPDTLSGLSSWAGWQRAILQCFAIFAIWASYLLIGLEVKNALHHDLGWSRWRAVGFVAIVPIILMIAGLQSFLVVVALVGGVFLGCQYVLILWVARRALTLSPGMRALVGFAQTIFLVAILYEIYSFVLS